MAWSALRHGFDPTTTTVAKVHSSSAAHKSMSASANVEVSASPTSLGKATVRRHCIPIACDANSMYSSIDLLPPFTQGGSVGCSRGVNTAGVPGNCVGGWDPKIAPATQRWARGVCHSCFCKIILHVL